MKRLLMLLIVGVIACCFAGCGKGHSDNLKECIDSDISEKNHTPDQDNYYSEIVLTDIFHNETSHILALFSQNVREDIGEEELTKQIKEGSETIEGELEKFTVKESPGSGTRGGNGPNYNSYEIYAYTDMDIYRITLLRCEGDRNKDKEYYKKSQGIEYIGIIPVSVLFLPDGQINKAQLPGADKETGMYATSGSPSKQKTYPDGNYTGYSVSVLQLNTYNDLILSGNKEYAEELLSELSSLGMSGEILEVHGIYDGDEAYAKEFSEGYNYYITSEYGDEFFVKFDPDAKAGQRVIDIRKEE